MSKELNHFGVIAGLFRQIGGHSSWFVLFCSFWRLFTIKMIKSVKVFPFSFWKIITIFFYFIKFKPSAWTCKMAAKWFNSLDTNSTWSGKPKKYTYKNTLHIERIHLHKYPRCTKYITSFSFNNINSIITYSWIWTLIYTVGNTISKNFIIFIWWTKP